jgi:predicted RND superfamily exporter protein
LIGIGVDDGVHFFHRYREDHDVKKAIYTTGTTLSLTTMTTVLGFGSLTLAAHQGLQSLGVLMAVGTITYWAACVIFLPALIKVTASKH